MKVPKSDVTGAKPRSAPVPGDVAKAVLLIRRSLCSPIAIADIAGSCGVAERTLNEHFRRFMGISPAAYLRQLRLVAVREQLVSGTPATSITTLARIYLFNHSGRFSEEYRRQFGELPSVTLQRARAASLARHASEKRKAGLARAGENHGRYLEIRSRQKPSIAIMPGVIPVAEPSLHWIAEAAAEAIAANLGSLRSLNVIVPAQTRVAATNPQRIAREMGARYFLTGNLIREDTRLRVTIRIADTSTTHHVWGDSFDGKTDQLFDLVDRIVRRIYREAVPAIERTEIDLALRSEPRDLDVHGLTMRALPLLYSSTPGGANRALELLNRAMETDPDYSVAAALAAWGHGQLVMYNDTSTPAEDRERSRQLAQRAAILDQDAPLVLAARSAVHMMLGELDESETLVRRALARDPASGWAWGRSGWLQAYKGNADIAIAHFRHSLRLGHASSRANIYAGIGSACFNAGRYGAAASWLRRSMAEQPGIAWANRSLSVSYARLGESELARKSLHTLQRTHPDLTVGRVVASVPFRHSFLERLGNGLNALGLPA